MEIAVALVLLLEDDFGLRFTYQEALEADGHEVIATATLDEALKVLKFHKPDALLFDLIINGETSIDVASYASYAAPNAEVVYITGSDMYPNGEIFNLSDNARWILRKPVCLKDLTNMMDHVVMHAASVAPLEQKAF